MSARREPSAELASGDRVLAFERVFDAPRALVWETFTKPEHLLKWMGPRSHPAISYEADARPGGAWRACLQAADGSGDLWQGGTIREVVEPERLSYTFAWDEDPGAPTPIETLVEITFEDLGDRTRIRFRQSPFHTTSNRDGHGAGWNSAFDRLVDYLVSAKTT